MWMCVCVVNNIERLNRSGCFEKCHSIRSKVSKLLLSQETDVLDEISDIIIYIPKCLIDYRLLVFIRRQDQRIIQYKFK